MSKYSFHCRTCGFTYLSDDKAEVKEVRNSHKRRIVIGADGFPKIVPKCVFIKTTEGTLARPDLAMILNNRRRTDVKQDS